MKTTRLLYPDHVGGGLSTYYLGAKLMSVILPENQSQKLVKVEVEAPDGREPVVSHGIASEDAVLEGIRRARAALESESPDRVITIGGNCLVSLASFDYLHARCPDAGIIWIDAHPDVSLPENGYPNAHAMVLATLLGNGPAQLASQLKAPAFRPGDVLYVGLQGLHDYQRSFLEEKGVPYEVQTERLVSEETIRAFLACHKQVLIHLDIDALDPRFFASTYFANPELVGDGSGGGRMTMEELAGALRLIVENAEVPGFTIAEYLPFDAERLQRLFAGISLFTEKSEA